MKSFNQYLSHASSKKDFLYNSLPNTHGYHSLDTQVKKVYDSLKLKNRKKIVEFTENTKHVDDWISENGNKHLGENSENSDKTHPQMEKLHELHEDSSSENSPAKKALKNYTEDSRELNHSLIRKTPYNGNISLDNLKKNFTPAKAKFKTYSGLGYNLENVKPVGKSEQGNNIYHSSCLTSSSIDKQKAYEFGMAHEQLGRTKHTNIIEHHVEPGDSVCVAGNHSTRPNEREIIHPENTSYEHTGTTHLTDDDGDIIAHVHHFKRVT